VLQWIVTPAGEMFGGRVDGRGDCSVSGGWRSRKTRRARWRLRAAQRFAAALAVGLLAREVGGGGGVQAALVRARRCSAQLSWRG